MPSLTLDTDQLSIQKVGFIPTLVYGSNFNLRLFLVASGIPYSANAGDTVTVILYKSGTIISGGAVQNLAIVGAPTFTMGTGSVLYMQVNVSLLTAQMAALVQTPGSSQPCFLHVTYTQADGESYPTTDIAITVTPNLTVSTAGTSAQAPAGYPTPGNIQVYNPLINGDFSVNQRLNTLTTLGSGQSIYTMDKWKLQSSGGLTGAVTITQDQQTVETSLPFVTPGWTGTSSWKLAVTTAQASPAAGDFQTLSQYIESSMWTPMLSMPFSVGFLAKTNVATTIGVFVQDSVLTYNYVVPILLTGDSNWHYYSASFLQPPSAATWNINSATNLWSAKFGFCFICGTTFTAATNNAWNTTGGFLAPVGQGNFLSSLTNVLFLTQVAISPGLFAQPWGQQPPAVNYALCERYYAKSYSIADAPGTAARISGSMLVASASTTSLGVGSADFPFPMRAAGTPTLYGPSSGTTNKAYDFNTAAEITITGASQINEKGFSGMAASATMTLAHNMGSHWGVDVDYAGTTGGN